MAGQTDVVRQLVQELSRFPGIGPRSAERIVFHILKSDTSWVHHLSKLLCDAKEKVFFCDECHNIAEGSGCKICRDVTRDTSIVCVVEEPKDVIAMENSGAHHGVYHVLLGALSPLNGIGPDDLRFSSLEERVKKGCIKEVVVASSFSADGEATALYLMQMLKPYGIKVSRIARGIPGGSHLEYVDQETLAHAFDGRVQLC